jgi:hypothetical protein
LILAAISFRKERQFKVRSYILFVFDEAQEFVRDLSNARGIKKDCSEKVETLFRQRRKYGLGGCIATKGLLTSTQIPCSNSIATLSVHCPGLMIETW